MVSDTKPDVSDDPENPELTEADFARAIPFRDAHPTAYEAWQRGRGRPKVERPKVKVAWRLAADVVDAVRASGKGYNARVEAILRDAMAKGLL